MMVVMLGEAYQINRGNPEAAPLPKPQTTELFRRKTVETLYLDRPTTL